MLRSRAVMALACGVAMFLALTAHSVTSQGSAVFGPQWLRTFQIAGGAAGRAVLSTGDGGLIVGGYRGLSGEVHRSRRQPTALEIRPSAIVDWSLCSESQVANYYDSLEAVAPAQDGGYVFVGKIDAPLMDEGPVFVLKTAGNGRVVWTRSFSVDGSADAVATTPDGGFVLVGNAHRFRSDGSSEGWIVRLDASGHVVWQQAVGGPSVYSRLYSVRRLSSGDFVAAGTIWSDHFQQQAWIIKFDVAGKLIWQRAVGEVYRGSYPLVVDDARSVCPTADGGCLVAGTRDYASPASDSGPSQLWVAKLNASGSVAWQKAYQGLGDTQGLRIFGTKEGSAIAIAVGDLADQEAGLVVKLSGTGGLIWQRSYPDCFFNDGFESDNGHLVLVGHRQPEGEPAAILVASLDRNGVLNPPCEFIRPASLSVKSIRDEVGNPGLAHRWTSAKPYDPESPRAYPPVTSLLICAGWQ